MTIQHILSEYHSDVIPIESDRFRPDSIVRCGQNPITGNDRFRPSEIIGSMLYSFDSDIRIRSGPDHRDSPVGGESERIRFVSFHLCRHQLDFAIDATPRIGDDD